MMPGFSEMLKELSILKFVSREEDVFFCFYEAPFPCYGYGIAYTVKPDYIKAKKNN